MNWIEKEEQQSVKGNMKKGYELDRNRREGQCEEEQNESMKKRNELERARSAVECKEHREEWLSRRRESQRERRQKQAYLFSTSSIPSLGV